MRENKKLNGAGRKAYTFNLRLDITEKFKKHCKEHGYLPSRRLEVLMKDDMKIGENL